MAKKQSDLKKQIDLEELIYDKSAPSQQDINHDRFGREIPDPIPMAPPVGYQKPFSMVDHLRDIVRREISAAAQSQEMETFEEADDFDIEDELLDPHTPYEAVFDPPAQPDPPATSRPHPYAPPPPPKPPATVGEGEAGGPPGHPPAPPASTAGSGTPSKAGASNTILDAG